MYFMERRHRRMRRTLFAVFLCTGFAPPAAAQAPDPRPGRLLLWSEGVKLWQREGESAALELAKGVLFDCAAHSPARDLYFEPSKAEVGGNSACRANQPANCAREAEKAFQKAVKLESLPEARLRLAWSRRGSEPGAAEFESLFNASGSPLDQRYLAGLFRAKVAVLAHEPEVAARWLSRTVSLNPSWLSGQLALWTTTTDQGQPVPEQSRTAPSRDDPWYALPCSILTPLVRDRLAEWTRRVRDDF
jgi:hypothetical protein